MRGNITDFYKTIRYPCFCRNIVPEKCCYLSWQHHFKLWEYSCIPPHFSKTHTHQRTYVSRHNIFWRLQYQITSPVVTKSHLQRICSVNINAFHAHIAFKILETPINNKVKKNKKNNHRVKHIFILSYRQFKNKRVGVGPSCSLMCGGNP